MLFQQIHETALATSHFWPASPILERRKGLGAFNCALEETQCLQGGALNSFRLVLRNVIMDQIIPKLTFGDCGAEMR